MPFFVPYCLLSGKPVSTLRQRFGFFTPVHSWQHKKRIWFHAASVGEVQAAISIISAFKQKKAWADIIITTVTEQGWIAATRQTEGTALCLLAPVDLPWTVNRFIRKLQPSVYVCLETELWPNMLRFAKSHGVTTILLNGRLSERAFERYKRIAPFISQVLRCFDAASVIQAIDRDRYISLGLDPEKIAVHGNAKYDLRIEPLSSPDSSWLNTPDITPGEALNRHYRCALMLGQSIPVLLAGSTHSGEEEMMLDVYETLATKIPNLVLIVAPRHLERLELIKATWQRKEIAFQTFSQVLANQRTSHIILVDSMGELAKLYAVATYVFCGGSLVPRGGHNIIEPAILGKSPFYGPYMSDFSDARALLESAEAGFTIHNVQELIDKIWYFHRHSEEYQQTSRRSLAVALAQQGSAIRQAELICQTLE
ncbi:MAG: glycosyltransferase N-terminal domain-containing protein [Desulfobulbaceae bacterium]|nr:glycosyltransferase N-terminal domain-containing protein [Desulfobulbaceae bacterium]